MHSKDKRICPACEGTKTVTWNTKLYCKYCDDLGYVSDEWFIDSITRQDIAMDTVMGFYRTLYDKHENLQQAVRVMDYLTKVLTNQR